MQVWSMLAFMAVWIDIIDQHVSIWFPYSAQSTLLISWVQKHRRGLHRVSGIAEQLRPTKKPWAESATCIVKEWIVIAATIAASDAATEFHNLQDQCKLEKYRQGEGRGFWAGLWRLGRICLDREGERYYWYMRNDMKMGLKWLTWGLVK